MIKLLHGADLHLDSPFSGCSPEEAVRRRSLQRQLPMALTTMANRLDCRLMLLAGDIFDGTPSPRTVQALQDLQQTKSETAAALAKIDALAASQAAALEELGQLPYETLQQAEQTEQAQKEALRALQTEADTLQQNLQTAEKNHAAAQAAVATLGESTQKTAADRSARQAEFEAMLLQAGFTAQSFEESLMPRVEIELQKQKLQIGPLKSTVKKLICIKVQCI